MRACDATWMVAWGTGGFPVAQGPGRTAQVCSAHTWAIVGDDWKWYPIIDQHPATGTYRRAPAAAPIAQAEWDRCYLPPHSFAPKYDCGILPAPPGVLVYRMRTLAQLPPSPRNYYSNLYGCGLTPPPTSSPTLPPPASPPTQTRAPTRTPPPAPVPCDTFPGGPICTPTATPPPSTDPDGSAAAVPDLSTPGDHRRASDDLDAIASIQNYFGSHSNS